MIRPWPFVGTLIGAVVMLLALPAASFTSPVMRIAAAVFYPTAGLVCSLVLNGILNDETA